jgi:hypothetical protein
MMSPSRVAEFVTRRLGRYENPDGGELVPPTFNDQPEIIMMKSRVLAKVSCGLSIAFLALAFTSGASMVRAQSQSDVPSWMMVDPISTAVKAAEDRITSLEAKVASVTEQLAARQSAERELCVADDAGARTCISKAQLDRLLKMMQSAAIEPPAQATSSVTALAEPAEAAPEVSAPETKAAAVEEKATEEKIETTTATAVEAPRQAEQAAVQSPEEDAMPTGSIPAPESQGRALVSHPQVEVTTTSTEN